MMESQPIVHLIERLAETQALLVKRLMAVADQQMWRPAPDAWSLRQIAAHLAVAEKGALFTRIRQIASGTQPQFDMYLNAPDDFPDDELTASLAKWQENRQAVFDYVLDLSPVKLTFTGTHALWGEISVVDYLKHFIEHDEEHLAELQEFDDRITGNRVTG